MKNNKEKRILVLKVNPDCKALRFDCDPFDDDDGMYCDKSGKWVRITEKDCAKCKAPVLLGLSRSEVIDKIADAIVKKIKEMGKGATPIFLAEAALNALLEDKK